MHARRLWPISLLLACVGFALLHLVQHQPYQTRPSASGRQTTGLEATATAYRTLAEALQNAGLVPLPADSESTAKFRTAIASDNMQWKAGTGADGQTTWQLGDGVVLLCNSRGAVERCILLIPGRQALREAELQSALEQLAELDESTQRPTSGVASLVARLHEQPFFFDFRVDAATVLRFTPGFSGGECQRIDIEQL